MKKLLLFTALLSTTFASFCPGEVVRQRVARQAPVRVAPVAAAIVTPGVIPAAQPVQNATPPAQAVGLNDQTLIQALANIQAALTGPDSIDKKIAEYKKLVPTLKAIKVTSLSPSKQTVIRETLKVLLEELDTLIGENEYWLYDTDQTSALKECRSEIASLITKFSGYWYGLPTQLYSFYKKHWRAPFKVAAVVLAGYSFKNGYNKLTK